MKVAVNLVGNATITVTIDDKVKFAMDPALDVKGSSLGFGIYRKKDPVYDAATFKNVDFWLMTHAHLDHIDKQGIDVVSKETPIVAAPSCKKTLQKFRVENSVKYIDWNERTVFEKEGYILDILAIPAYHGYGKLVVKLMTRVNGYVIRIKKGNEEKIMYITSDTVYNQQVVKALSDVESVDILIANLGEAKAPLPVTRKPITMDLQSLQKFEQLTTAKNVIPLHMDDYSHFSTNVEEVGKRYPLLKDGEVKVYNI